MKTMPAAQYWANPLPNVGLTLNANGTITVREPGIDAPLPQPAPVYVPAPVTPRQARLALLAAGKLAAVNAALAAMAGAQGEAARIAWEYATEISRNDPLVTSLGVALGMNAAALDALFEQAALL